MSKSGTPSIQDKIKQQHIDDLRGQIDVIDNLWMRERKIPPIPQQYAMNFNPFTVHCNIIAMWKVVRELSGMSELDTEIALLETVLAEYKVWTEKLDEQWEQIQEQRIRETLGISDKPGIVLPNGLKLDDGPKPA